METFALLERRLDKGVEAFTLLERRLDKGVEAFTLSERRLDKGMETFALSERWHDKGVETFPLTAWKNSGFMPGKNRMNVNIMRKRQKAAEKLQSGDCKSG